MSMPSLFRRVLVVASAAFTLASLQPAAHAAPASPQPQRFGSGAGSFLDQQAPSRARKSPHVLQRRGLAVIADFADTRFENWQGPGYNDPQQIASQLRQMADHWAWLSRGKESFQWDIIRITMPAPLGMTSYSSWWDYRNAVAVQIRQQVDVSRYDGNKDGVIDSVWVIPSNMGMNYAYLIGGMS